MPILRFRVRTLMIAVAVTGLWMAFVQPTTGIKSENTVDFVVAGLVLAIPFYTVMTIVLDALGHRRCCRRAAGVVPCPSLG